MKLSPVVDKKWLEALATLAKAFTRAKVRTFHPDQIDEAKVWIDAD